MIDISNISIAAAFAAGVISFLSPCVLPLVPGYVSYVAGHSIAGRSAGTLALRLQTVALSACFVLGFSTIFVLLGASATALGQVLLSYRHELNLVGGAVVIAFGLLTLGLLRPTWLQRDHRFHLYMPGGRPLPGTDKRYVRRDEKGQFKESDDVGKSLAQDAESPPRRR